MSDQQETTIDDVWVNRLANRIGILTAQNERLQIENEALQQRIMQLQMPTMPPFDSIHAEPLNGETQGVSP
jgi:hypothetical protein